MDEDKEGVVFNIRACIISSKGPVSVRDLNRDYETLVGSPIPYRNLNYSTLESFLQSLPSLRVFGSGRDSMVEAASDQTSSHITSLISKQKPAKKNNMPSRRGPPPRFYGQARGYTPRYAPRDYSVPKRYPPPIYSEPKRYPPPIYSEPKRYPPPPPIMSFNSHPSSSSQPAQTQSPPRRRQPYSSSEPVEPLVVKVNGNEKRQVSVTEPYSSHKTLLSSQKPRYELPPRLQKAQMQKEVSQTPSISTSLSPKEPTQNINERLFFDETTLSELDLTTESVGPSRLLAAGRAKKQAAELAQYKNILLQDPLLSGSQAQTEPSSNFPQFSQMDLIQQEHQIQHNLLPTEMLDLVPEEFVPEPVSVPEPDEIFLENNKDLLHQYCMANGWSVPEYVTWPKKPKNARCPVGANVKINIPGQGVKCVSSYPMQDLNLNVAQSYAAKEALKELRKEEKVKLDKNVISSNKNVICDRVSSMVAGKDNGIFSKDIEVQYLEKYLECLPEGWVETLSSCSSVVVDQTLNDFIILPRDPSDATSSQVLSEQAVPPALETPSDDNWYVYVTYATSTCNVWFRLIGENYSEQYEELLSAMEDFYTKNGDNELALNIEEDQFYAAQTEDRWFRVCAYQVNEESKTVTAWLIDHGENEIFPFSNLYRLPSEFCILPRQAVQCSLEGLENFAEDPFAIEVVATSEDLIGKTLIAQINFNDQETNCLKVTLYDTSGTDDVNVNEKLLESIIYGKADPELPNEGCAMEVYIGSVSKRGEVYIQVAGPTFNRISTVLDSLGSEEISKHKLTSYRQVALDHMYLAKYSKDDAWYRAVVTETPSVQQNKIAVRFVDFGNTETVSIAEIAEVDTLPALLKRLPAQAVKVALHNLPVETLSNTEVAKLHSLLLDEEKVVLVKTVMKHEDPPVVEIFYKNDANNSALVSVNNTIALSRPEEKNTNSLISKTNSNSFAITNGHGGVSTDLKRPEFELGEFLAVYIVLAANPGNFYFQPLKYARDINTLQRQLQAYYGATTLPELTKKDIVKGGLYAAHNLDDLTWYRAVVTESFIGSRVPVRFCDYGDMVCVSLSELKELEAEFREMPFMAVKGNLAGVVPIHTDWSVEDCMRFQDLVVETKMASVVMYVEEHPDPMDTVVSLHLVDTNSDKDKVISEILINENRAVKKKS